MGFHSQQSISQLVGRKLVQIDVENGEVYFDVEVLPGQFLEHKIGSYFHLAPDYITSIEGDLANLIDTPILIATYDPDSWEYTIGSEYGTVVLSADGPDTAFEAC